MKKVLLLSVLFIVIFGGCGYLLYKNREENEAKKQEAARPVSLVMVGDIMMDRGVKSSVNKNMKGDYNALFTHTPYIRDADIAFANLEGPIATSGKNVGSKYSFRMDPQSLTAMDTAGFDVVSFANNHVGDYSKVAFDETRKRLGEAGIVVSGAGENAADAATVKIITIRGVRVGFIASTDVGPTWMKAGANTSGVLLSTDPQLAQIITKAKSVVDVLVVSFHFGEEYSLPTKRQTTLAHRAVDAGADIVVGHHPHVMQRMETYKGKPIFYSLGNFIFDQSFSVHTMRGMVVEIQIDPKTKELAIGQFVAPLSKEFVPHTRTMFDESVLINKPFRP